MCGTIETGQRRRCVASAGVAERAAGPADVLLALARARAHPRQVLRLGPRRVQKVSPQWRHTNTASTRKGGWNVLLLVLFHRNDSKMCF